MNKTVSFLFVLTLYILGSYTTFAQTHRLSGTIMDQPSKTPIIGAIVILNEKADTTRQYTALTDVNGRFVIYSLKSNSYRLTIQNLSYKKLMMPIEMKGKDINLGIVELEPDSKVLNEVVVVGQGPAAVQKGDTTEMSSSAYKTTPDANAEDLVKKMPGITVENGTVKAQGEAVKKILVDGKQFFGDDPMVALKNLPADVIDKVQVFNKLSEQSELTGVDDGNSARTINIITKTNRRSGQFGKFIGGTDFSNKYLAGGNVNLFKGNRRITILGTLNNINQQNFSSEDLGTSGGGRRGGNDFGGSQNGITNTKSLGVNLTDTWGKKINVNASYFYNSTDNSLNKETNTENIFRTDGKYSSNNSNTRTRNYNHRFNMRFEYAIDSMNTLLILPRLSTTNNDVNRSSLYNITGGKVNSSTRSLSMNGSDSYNLSNNIIFRHKFNKPRRTLSFNLSTGYSDRDAENTQLAVVDSVPDNQVSDNVVSGLNLSANVTYTEPITTYGMLIVNANSSVNRNETDKETYRLGDNNQRLNRLDSLSNVYNNDYNTNRGGLGYMVRKGQFNMVIGVDYQQANLLGNQVYPQAGKINRSFENVLPNMMMMYKMSKGTNLRIFYRTSTDAPSIAQLQKVTDNSNRLNLSTGNPNLKQEYTQTLSSQFSYANADKGLNAFMVLSGGFTRDYIGDSTIYQQHANQYIPEYNVILRPGGQLNVPVNLDYSYNLRTLVNVGKYVKFIRSNISILAGVSHSQNPAYIDTSVTVLNRSNSYSYTNSLILASNISEKLDFSLSYTSNYSIVKNTQDLKNLKDTKYWYQSANFRFSWIFFKNFILQSDVAGQYNRGLSGGFNQNYVVWNASFGKKFLKNNAAELKLSVFDILNQNNNINRTVTASTIQDSRTNTFPRYYLLIFTYNLRNFNGQSASSSEGRRFERGEHGDHGDRMMPHDGGDGGGHMDRPRGGF